MLHLRQDWQGIQDVRKWLLAELDGVEAMLDNCDGPDDVDEVAAALTATIDRLRAETGVSKDDVDLTPDGSSIEDDEPVFIVRAKDPCFKGTVVRWSQLALMKGSDPQLIQRVRAFAEQGEQYAVEHGWRPGHAPDAPSLLPMPADYQTAAEEI